MNINFNNYNYNRNNIYNRHCSSKPNFCAGKTKIYTDFDGTIFPFEQYKMESKDYQTVSDAKKMYAGLNDFIEKSKKNISFMITTGRTHFEMLVGLLSFTNSGAEFIKPEGFIVDDGAKEIENIYNNLDTLAFYRTKSDGSGKLKQPKEDVRKIVLENSDDLVVVAGNDYNDADMLNPLNYLDIYGVNIDRDKSIEEILNDKSTIIALKRLPLVSVVAGNGENIQSLLRLKKALDKRGIHKIFTAKNPQIDYLPQIKKGMKIYADNNVFYKNNLGYELYNEIFENEKTG